MAISTWKASLDDIATAIRTETKAFNNSIARVSAALANLNSLATVHADAIAEIQALGTDPAEEVAKDELAKLTAEFIALRDSISATVTAIEAV